MIFKLHYHIWFTKNFDNECLLVFNILNERKREQAHVPHAPTLLENAAHYAYYNYEGGIGQ